MRGRLALVAAMTVALAACGGSGEKLSDNDDGVVIDNRAALFDAAR